MDLAIGTGNLAQLVAFCGDGLGIESIDLVEADDFRLFGEAMTISGQFFADRAVGVGDIVERAVHEVKNSGAAFDMAEESGADARSFARSFDQSRQIGKDKFLVVQPNDAKLRLQGR